MGVSISDLITLAKAGYTPGQVKELISLSEKSGQEPMAEEPPAATGANVEPKPASEEPKEATENAQPAKTEDSVDYKSLYEQTKADLDKAQKTNVNQNASAVQTEDADKHLRETISSFL
mgnify:CR=1 FL=1